MPVIAYAAETNDGFKRIIANIKRKGAKSGWSLTIKKISTTKTEEDDTTDVKSEETDSTNDVNYERVKSEMIADSFEKAHKISRNFAKTYKVSRRKHKAHVKESADMLKNRQICAKPCEPILNHKEELDKHRLIIRTVMRHSNATPFQAYHVDEGFGCCFCETFFQKASDLKLHTIHKHNYDEKDKFKENSTSLFTYVVKLDVTDLCCNICNMQIGTLEQLIIHFQLHEIYLNTDIKNQIVCFTFVDKDLRCIFCLHEFNNFKLLLEHMNCHYKNYECGDCGNGFINYRMLIAHCDGQDATVGEVKCPLCDKLFTSLSKFKKHEILAHSNFYLNTHKCSHCGDTFNSDEDLCSHVTKVHQSQHVYQCNGCKKSYPSKDQLLAHTRRAHSHEEDFKCNVCNKRFSEERRLINHMQRHSDSRQYQCDLCAKMFKYKETLVRHIKTHTLKGKHHCLACDESFFRKSYLDDHVKQIHMNQTRTKCMYCDKLFYETQLKQHMARRHPEFSRFKCEICTEIFDSKYLLVEHMGTHNVLKPKPKNFECLACGKKFDRKVYVMKHTQRIHLLEKRFVCDHCGKSFADTTALKNHVATHSATNQFQCFGCPRTFKTKKTMMNHARNHMEERKVKCDICQQGFIYPYLLKEHMKNSHKIVQ